MNKSAFMVGCIAVLGIVGFVVVLTQQRDEEKVEHAKVVSGSSKRAVGGHVAQASVAAQNAGQLASAKATVSDTSAQQLPPLNLSVVQILVALKKQASDGNSRAACRLGFELDRCSLYFKDKAIAEEMRVSIASQPPDSPKLQGFQRMLARVKTSVSKLESICEGLAQEELSGSNRYLFQAASAGQEAATVRYLNGIGLDWDAGPLANKDEWSRFAENFGHLLSRAINSGRPEALEIAANAYLKPTFGEQLLPKDAVQAIAHLYALKQISSASYRDVVQYKIDAAIGQSGLSSTQLETARVIAGVLVAKMIYPAEGVDFSKGTFAGETGAHCEE